MGRLLTTDLVHKVDAADAAIAFRELTRPREGLLSLGGPGTLMAVSADEALEILSALLTDTDGNGLGDYPEVTTYGCNPSVADTDGDGFEDLFEVKSRAKRN